jgi:hypothetical protein
MRFAARMDIRRPGYRPCTGGILPTRGFFVSGGFGVNIGGCLPRLIAFVLILAALIALVVVLLGAAADTT